ncbi:MAG: PilZ domain-containing protein [Nitrospirota bacterium]
MQKTKIRNRRQHERSVGSGTVEYSVISSAHDTVSYGIISDISPLGMCLLTPIPLQRGEKILVKNDAPTTMSKTAEVLWSDIGAFFFKAGLKFL